MTGGASIAFAAGLPRNGDSSDWTIGDGRSDAVAMGVEAAASALFNAVLGSSEPEEEGTCKLAAASSRLGMGGGELTLQRISPPDIALPSSPVMLGAVCSVTAG
eukprot:scaffold216813_cov31-Tisochrysis_lutea.AAC.3